MDLLLDPVTHDALFVNGQCPVTTERVDVVAQRLKIRLLTFLGEWFLNTNYGVPYWQRILGFKQKKEAVDLIFQQKILEESGVKELTFFNSTLTNRQYTLSFRVKVTSGAETSTITITPTA